MRVGKRLEMMNGMGEQQWIDVIAAIIRVGEGIIQVYFICFDYERVLDLFDPAFMVSGKKVGNRYTVMIRNQHLISIEDALLNKGMREIHEFHLGIVYPCFNR